MDDDIKEKQPTFYELLNADDKKSYEDLRKILNAPDHRYNRNKRIVTFNDMLDQIRKFCCRGDNDDWKRYLVCGICWINDDIAINTRQLRLLLGKSKSTINGAFSKMNYETLPFKNHDAGLQEKIPFLKGNFTEARQWTVRRLSSHCISDCPTADATIASSPQEAEKPQIAILPPIKAKDTEVIEFPSQDLTMSLSNEFAPYSPEFIDEPQFSNDFINNDFGSFDFEYNNNFEPAQDASTAFL